MGERRDFYRVLWRILSEGDYLNDTELHECIIFKWIFKKWFWGMGWFEVALDMDWLREMLNAAL